jgi:hypothetical protein
MLLLLAKIAGALLICSAFALLLFLIDVPGRRVWRKHIRRHVRAIAAERAGHTQDTPRPRVPHANEGRVSQRPEYRSRGPRRAS